MPNGENSEQVVFLHTITVPSPTGTGNATATINYTTDGTRTTQTYRFDDLRVGQSQTTGNRQYVRADEAVLTMREVPSTSPYSDPESRQKGEPPDKVTQV